MIDVNRPIQTKCGKPARILSSDLKGRFSLVVAIEFDDKTEVACSLNKEGRGSAYDVVNTPYKREGWANLYRGTPDYRPEPNARIGQGYLHATKVEAEAAIISEDTYIKTVKIEWEQ